MFHRFQSAVPNGRGRFPGVFAMTNGLLRAGLLSDADEEWVREENARGELAYTDPSSVVLDCYSPTTNPGARSWFRSEARELLAMTSGYTALLDRYGISWVELRTERPGRGALHPRGALAAAGPRRADGRGQQSRSVSSALTVLPRDLA
jgi:hypothetical protein